MKTAGFLPENVSKLITVVLLTITICLLATACATAPDGNHPAADVGEQLPWNAPAGWEGRVLGVPY